MNSNPILSVLGLLTAVAAPVATAQQETLRYNFEELSGSLANGSPVLNTAPDAVNNGTVVVLESDDGTPTADIVEDQIVTFAGQSYSLGKSLELRPVNLIDGFDKAAHINANNTIGFFGITGQTQYTAMAWARIDDGSDLPGGDNQDNMIFGSIGEEERSLHLGARDGFYHSGHWGDDLEAPAAPPFATGEWHHVTFTNDSDGAQSIYVDGELASQPDQQQSGGNPPPAKGLVIGTSPRTGSYSGGLDEIRVFSSLLTPEEIRAEIPNGLDLVPIPSFIGARIIDNERLEITIRDFVGTPNATVSPGSISLSIEGAAVSGETASKAGDITTVAYMIPPAGLPAPLGSLSFQIGGVTEETAVFTIDGSTRVAALPNTLLGASPTSPDSWLIDEYNADTIPGALPTSVNGIEAHQAMVATVQAGVTPSESYTAPVVEFEDPEAPGAGGIFNRAIPFATNTDGADNDIVLFARTIFRVDAASTHTFSIQGDDGYAFRVRGASLEAVGGGSANVIDMADSSTAYSIGRSTNVDALIVCNFPAAGDYVIELIYRESTAGAFIEVSSTEGSFLNSKSTLSWKLVGNPDDTSVPSGGSRFLIPPAELPPIPADGTWGTRWYYQASTPDEAGLDSLQTALAFLSNIGGDAAPTFSTGPIDGTSGFINYFQSGGFRGTFDENVRPPSSPVDEVDDSVLIARMNFTVTTAGDYSFHVQSDDGFLFRFADPTIQISGVTGLGNAFPDAPNEFFFAGISDNSDTIAVANLPVGTHEIQFFYYERDRGLNSEIAFAEGAFQVMPAPPETRLLGALIVPPEVMFQITEISVGADNSVSVTFASDQDLDYSIELSTDLVTFSAIEENFIPELGDESTFTLTAEDIDEALGNSDPRTQLFVRLREVPL